MMAGQGTSTGSPTGPFGMGRQGYLILAIIILGSALFATTRRDWISMIVSALVLPLVMFGLVHLLSRFWGNGLRTPDGEREARPAMDPLTFAARTNPFMFLLLGAFSRRTGDDRYEELLRTGPYGLGQYGYLITLLILLAPLALTFLILVFTGQLPAHNSPQFP